MSIETDQAAEARAKSLEEERLRVMADKVACSSKVSELCRYIGFGLTIASFNLLTSTSTFAVELVKQYKLLLALSATLGCLAVLFDLVQYIGGYLSSLNALKTDKPGEEYTYDDDTWYYQIRSGCYVVKQLFAVSGSILLIVIMLLSIF